MKGEACADMAAVKCILRIAAGKEDFDYDKFFRAFADRYACSDTPVMAMTRLVDVCMFRYPCDGHDAPDRRASHELPAC